MSTSDAPFRVIYLFLTCTVGSIYGFQKGISTEKIEITEKQLNSNQDIFRTKSWATDYLYYDNDKQKYMKLVKNDNPHEPNIKLVDTDEIPDYKRDQGMKFDLSSPLSMPLIRAERMIGSTIKYSAIGPIFPIWIALYGIND